jgi:hypothetical protein
LSDQPPDGDRRAPWNSGTFTLLGVSLGALIGVIIEQLPIATGIGTAIGAALDALMRRLRSEDE